MGGEMEFRDALGRYYRRRPGRPKSGESREFRKYIGGWYFYDEWKLIRETIERYGRGTKHTLLDGVKLIKLFLDKGVRPIDIWEVVDGRADLEDLIPIIQNPEERKAEIERLVQKLREKLRRQKGESE